MKTPGHDTYADHPGRALTPREDALNELAKDAILLTFEALAILKLAGFNVDSLARRAVTICDRGAELSGEE